VALRPVTKFGAEIDSPGMISELVGGRFRIAESGRPGATLISARQDVMVGEADGEVLTAVSFEVLGPANAFGIAAAVDLINRAERPILLIGLFASQPANSEAVRELLRKTRLTVVATYQAAGVVPLDFFDFYGGRIGLFHTQPADQLLDGADLVIAVGYDPIEYESGL
jgi:acetolactate synthase I/II/III large subunit